MITVKKSQPIKSFCLNTETFLNPLPTEWIVPLKLEDATFSDS